MKTVITKTGTLQGSTDVTCTQQITILRPTFGIGAETEIATLVQQVELLREDVVNLNIELQQEKTIRQQTDSALALEIGNALTYIQQIQTSINQQIQMLTDLINSIAGIYPKLVMSGKRTNNGPVFRPIGSEINFTDTAHFIVLINPIGGHEAWDIHLFEDRFEVNCYSRSGTRRDSFYGDIHYAVIQVLKVPTP